MKNIENLISNSKNISYHYQILELFENAKLSKSEIEEFNLIWAIAVDFENWKDSDLILGCKVAHQRLKENFNLSDECIGVIVKAASYDWK